MIADSGDAGGLDDRPNFKRGSKYNNVQTGWGIAYKNKEKTFSVVLLLLFSTKLTV